MVRKSTNSFVRFVATYLKEFNISSHGITTYIQWIAFVININFTIPKNTENLWSFDLMHAPCDNSNRKCERVLSAKKRKCALEFTAYSWDYCAKQWCGLAIVHLIYSTAPHLPSVSSQKRHSWQHGWLGLNLKVQRSKFPSSCC